MKLNYNHLRYFRAIAHERSLTRAAQHLHISQSALSAQLAKLEAQLGQPLFDRVGRRLELNEAGRIALDYADSIFDAGEELLDTLAGRGTRRRPLRVGALTTLSRNFQLALLQSLVGREDVELVLQAGTEGELLARLQAHDLDLMLSNRPLRHDAGRPCRQHLLRVEPVSLVGPPGQPFSDLRFPADLDAMPVLLPGTDSEIRSAIDRVFERGDVQPSILAEVDDMAMLRLLARESHALAVVPPIVVRDEIAAGLLVEHYRIPEISERFYAITPRRRFPNPLLAELLGHRSQLDTAGRHGLNR